MNVCKKKEGRKTFALLLAEKSLKEATQEGFRVFAI
jgi:hypothetical protein